MHVRRATVPDASSLRPNPPSRTDRSITGSTVPRRLTTPATYSGTRGRRVTGVTAGAIVAAISLSSAAQYMDDARMDMLTEDVRATAQKVSADLGWTPGVKSPRRPVRR